MFSYFHFGHRQMDIILCYIPSKFMFVSIVVCVHVFGVLLQGNSQSMFIRVTNESSSVEKTTKFSQTILIKLNDLQERHRNHLLYALCIVVTNNAKCQRFQFASIFVACENECEQHFWLLHCDCRLKSIFPFDCRRLKTTIRKVDGKMWW